MWISQFNSAFAVSFHSTRSEGATLQSGLTVARFFSTNHISLLRIATNEIATFWMDHRSRQMAFFRAKAGQKAGFRVILRYFQIKKAFCYYIKQIDSMLPCVWFSNRSQKTSKCSKNISDTLGYASCATFLFLPHFDVICDLLLNRRTATWNLFVKLTESERVWNFWESMKSFKLWSGTNGKKVRIFFTSATSLVQI